MIFRILALACLVGGTSSANAQTVDPAFPRSIVNALQSLGLRATLEKDDAGDPMILSGVSGANFTIWFYGCDQNVNCDAIQLSAGFDTTDAISMSVANDWNRSRVIGEAWVNDEGDPFLTHFVVADGGIPLEVFESIIRRWEVALADYQDAIGW
jgi:hypothetical protein